MTGRMVRTRRGFRRAAILALAATFCALGSPTFHCGVFAQTVQPAQPMMQANGGSVKMPLKRPVSRKTGLSLLVDSRWTNSYGYRPLKVTISSATATTADHLITIRLHTGWNKGMSVEQDFEFPLGSTSATTIVTLPMYQMAMNYFWWDIWVDGIKDKDLSLDKKDPVAWTGGGGSASGASLTFLVAGPSKNERTLVSTNSLEFEVLSLTLAEFPRRWIDYTCLDVVALSLTEAQQLAQQNPSAFEAISRWARTGGQIWISDVGSEWEHLPEVSKLFQLSENLISVAGQNSEVKADTAEDDSDEHKVESGWRSLRFRRGSSDGQVVTFLEVRTGTSRTVRDPEVIARLKTDPNFVTTNSQYEPVEMSRERRFAPDSGEWFVEQSLGLGSVRALRGANEAGQFPQTPPVTNPNVTANSNTMETLPRALSMGLRRAQHWDARHGMTPESANAEFAKLLVPGVGLAPVTEFRVLITLFVLLIGPLNYWLLKRSKRLQLLVLTVPLAAAVTTAALFAYAIISDGFDTKVRTHSFTSLDQRSGDAVCWSRVSYYAGLAPGHGLTIPGDTVVYPILPGWMADASAGGERDLLWTANEAKLTRGWLNSRTPTQYLTLRSRKSPIRLEILSDGEKLRATNRLGTRIKSALVINGAGKIFSGDGLANDATAMLQPISRDDAIRRINGLITDNRPQAPEALSVSESDFVAMQGRPRMQMYGRYSLQSNSAKLSENLAAAALSDLAGLAGQPALALPPRSYVAITETGPEVELGVPYAKEEASFHVLVGKW